MLLKLSNKPNVLPLLLSVLLLIVGACTDTPDAEPAPESPPAIQRGPIPVAATNLATRAQMASGEGNPAQALRAIDEALRRAPHFMRAHFLRGQILTQMGNLDEAKIAFEQAVRIDATYPNVQFHLGNNAVARRQFREALDHFEAEQTLLTPETPVADQRALWLQKGNVHKALGEVKDALAAYQQAQAVDEAFDLAYDAIGQFHQEEGNLQEALEARQQALALNPENGQYAYHVGALLYQLDRPDEAVPYLEQAERQIPWFHGVHYNLGRSLIALGQTTRGEQYLLAADTLQQRQAKLGLAKARAEAQRTPAAWLTYAEMLYNDERYDEALHAYRAVQALDPSNTSAGNAVNKIQQQLNTSE